MTGEIPKVVINIKNVAVISGLLQGLTWTVMSIMCIVYYNRIDVDEMELNSYMDIVNKAILVLYMRTGDSYYTNQTVTGGVFQGFAIMYLILSLSWIVLSVWLIKRDQLMFQWSYFTILVSVLDAISVIVFAADYGRCLTAAEDIAGQETVVKIGLEALCANGILTVMVIAGRGFLLWAFNMFLSLALIKIGTDLNEDTNHKMW